jgi:CpeT/CpcT family (DUF1001)
MKFLGLAGVRLAGSIGVLTGLLTGAMSTQSVVSANVTAVDRVDRVVRHLEGVMDTAAQAVANPQAANVTMTTCRIQVAAADPAMTGAVYLYQEQARSLELPKPYRQRILEITDRPLSNTVRSRSFKLANPTAWVNFCDRAERMIDRADFPEVVCAVFLKESGKGFAGTTPADGCPTKARGAVLIRNRIELSDGGMDTWDRGFDGQGRQIWGAKTESYQFRWKR